MIAVDSVTTIQENAAMMLRMAEELIREAEKLKDAKKSELYSMAVDAVRKLEGQYNNVESVELKVTSIYSMP